MSEEVDRTIIEALRAGGIDFVCSVPDGLLAGVLRGLSGSGIVHIPVTREEEGVGVCAGAYLGGLKPCLLMQNSGLGNCINALLSLNQFYGIPLFLLMGHRGDPLDPVAAQIPMGWATPALLEVLAIPYALVKDRQGLASITELGKLAFQGRTATAVLLGKEVWP